MTGDCHVRFCESPGLQCPGPLTAHTTKTKAKPKKTRTRKHGKR